MAHLKQYSDSLIIQTIQEAGYILGHPPEGPSYDRLAEINPSWPKRVTIIKRFGSWRKALEAAGMPCNRNYLTNKKKYTDEEIINALRDAAKAGIFSTQAYTKYAKEKSMPSVALIQHRFGSWRAAQQAAGIFLPFKRTNKKLNHFIQVLPQIKSILAKRPFLIPDDAETLGLKREDLRLFANKYKLLFINRKKLGQTLVKIAELGFPDINYPKGRYVALSLAQGKTLTEIGKELGLSRERVRQLIMKYYKYCITEKTRKRRIVTTYKYEKRTTDKREMMSDLYHSLNELAKNLGRIPHIKDYNALRRSRKDLPSIPTLQAIFGSWGKLLYWCFIRKPQQIQGENQNDPLSLCN